jgi:hypothetical protein
MRYTDEWIAKRLADLVVAGWLVFTLVSIARNKGWL